MILFNENQLLLCHRSRHLLWGVFIILLFFLFVPAHATDEEDRVTLTGGQTMNGKAGIIVGNALPFHVRTGTNDVTVRYRLDQIVQLDLYRTPQQREMIQKPVAASLSALLLLWDQEWGLLPVKGSDLGEIGLACAKGWLDGGKKTQKKKAEAILDGVIQGDWNEARRLQAKELKLQMAGASKRIMGNTSAAVEPSKIQDQFKTAQALKKEWESMSGASDLKLTPENKVRRELILQRALDTYVTVWLDTAAAGSLDVQAKFEAATLASASGRIEESCQWYADVIRLSPTSSLAREAKNQLQKMESTRKKS